MPKISEFSFISSDGVTIINALRCDTDGVPRGIVQLAHGVSEHIQLYEEFARFLGKNGFITVGNDHLGHGQSVRDESFRGYFADSDGWSKVVQDMHRLHDTLVSEHPELPFFLFGHSMGSFLTRTYIINYPSELNGAIICGTGHQRRATVDMGEALSSLMCTVKGAKHRSALLNSLAFGSYNSGFKPPRTQLDWLSRDETAVDKFIADPLCGQISTAGLYRDMMGGIKYITDINNLVKMRKTLPILFISGDKDPVGENGRGVKRAYEAFKTAGMEDVSIKLYPDCRHELLNELNRDKVMSDVLDWLCDKLDY